MFQIIRQFTFHRPKEIIQPTVWLFLSQACSMLPAILAYMAIYTLGQAFVPPYTLDLQFLITLAAIGLGYILLQYAIELVSYYFTYGRAYSDTAKKRVAYIQKLRRQPLGFFSSKESGELISSFANDFSNVEYTLCYWLPYPLVLGRCLQFPLYGSVCMTGEWESPCLVCCRFARRLCSGLPGSKKNTASRSWRQKTMRLHKSMNIFMV